MSYYAKGYGSEGVPPLKEPPQRCALVGLRALPGLGARCDGARRSRSAVGAAPLVRRRSRSIRRPLPESASRHGQEPERPHAAKPGPHPVGRGECRQRISPHAPARRARRCRGELLQSDGLATVRNQVPNALRARASTQVLHCLDARSEAYRPHAGGAWMAPFRRDRWHPVPASSASCAGPPGPCLMVADIRSGETPRGRRLVALPGAVVDPDERGEVRWSREASSGAVGVRLPRSIPTDTSAVVPRQ